MFSSKVLDVYSTNMPTLNSFMKAGSGGILGVGVGDVSAYQYGYFWSCPKGVKDPLEVPGVRCD